MGIKINICIVILGILLAMFYVVAMKFNFYLQIYEYPSKNTCRYHS